MNTLANAAAGGSLLTGFQVLKCLTEGGPSLGVTQVAERALLPKATTYRVLQTLRRLGYVEQHLPTKKYRLSPCIFGFLHFLTSHFSPIQKTTQVLRETAARLGATVHLSMLAGDVAYVVAASGPFGDTQVLGSHTPAMDSAGGRVLVAQLPEEDLQKFLADLPSTSRLDLQSIREKGVAWDDAAEDIRAVAAAVAGTNGSRLAVTLLYTDAEHSLDPKAAESQVLRLAQDVADAVCVMNFRPVLS